MEHQKDPEKARENFNGRRILALENRRAIEIAKLIRGYGGVPIVAPAMREIPLESNHEALEFTGELLRGDFDLVVFMTGVGIRKWLEIAESAYERARVLESLRHIKVAARGSKPGAVLRELGIPIAVSAPEPSTWREVIAALEMAFGGALLGMRIAVQEYGAPNPELIDALSQHGVVTRRVPVYQWALPEDLEPLRNAIRAIADGEVDAIVFLTAMQAVHLFRVAEEIGAVEALREGLRKTVILSIGPSTTEELARLGVPPDLEASHPKMGFLINEAAARTESLLAEKQSRATSSRHA
jgi:uroporphyrinogen-III synthase